MCFQVVWTAECSVDLSGVCQHNGCARFPPTATCAAAVLSGSCQLFTFPGIQTAPPPTHPDFDPSDFGHRARLRLRHRHARGHARQVQVRLVFRRHLLSLLQRARGRRGCGGGGRRGGYVGRPLQPPFPQRGRWSRIYEARTESESAGALTEKSNRLYHLPFGSWILSS